MRDSVRWKGRASVVVIAVLLVGLSVVAAVADTVGTGNFTIDIDTNTGSYSGALIFDDSPQVVFGTPVNLGTQVDSDGSAFISGQVTFNNSTSPISGTITQDVSSDDEEGDSLTFHADGSVVCSPTGCTDGSPGSYVSTVTSISGTVYDSLPPGLSYRTEGTFSCCVGGDCVPAVANNIQHCTGPFALNAFEPGTGNTVVSAGTETLSFIGSFFDPFTGTVRDFDIDVIFEGVSVAGNTTVAGASNAPGTLPPHVVPHIAHFDALFFDVSTTATVVGDITVCVHYNDADGDGFVDGTGVHETSLRFLHHEGDQLVDRTTSNAIFHNKVCGTLQSLSLSGLLVSVVGQVPPDAANLACENTAMKSMGRFGGGIVQCHSRAATGTAVALQECLTDTAQKYGGRQGDTVAKVTALCGLPDCTTGNLGAVSDTLQREMESLVPQIFCVQAPGAFALKCEARAAKSVAKLSDAVAKCNMRAATSALAGTTKNVASECLQRVLDKFDAGTAKLRFLGCGNPDGAPCAVANLDTVRLNLKDALESIGGPIYCEPRNSSCVLTLTAVTNEDCVFGF